MRIYALSEAKETTPNAHAVSPIKLSSYPAPGTEARVYLGAVPAEVLEGMKQHRAWVSALFQKDVRSAAQVRQIAKDIPDNAILANEQDPRTAARKYWYVTLVIADSVELPEDPKEGLYGVDVQTWSNLGETSIPSKHADILDRLALNIAIAVSPYRYKWLAWNSCLVTLPSGITLAPMKFIPGQVRGFVAPQLQNIAVGDLQAEIVKVSPRIGPMAIHFYLQAMVGVDRIERFFDAFRAIESICGKGNQSLTDRFSALASNLNKAEAELDITEFKRLYAWRNDLAHGKRKLLEHEAPDEEAFELLHKYMTKLNRLVAN